MLAKPEYFSLPDEVCCRQRRCGEAVAGRGPSAQRTAGRDAAAKSHREDAAGRECHGEEDGGTVAESHREELLAGAPWQSCQPGSHGRPWEAGTATSTSKESNLPEGSTIGKTLLAGALQRRAIGKQARKEPPLQARKEPQLQAGKEHPALQANKKESGKAHSLKPALVMTALVRVTGARPRGSSQLLLCSLELLW